MSLQAGEGRGSSVKAKSYSKAALRGCRDGAVGTATSWPGGCLSKQLSRVGIYAGPASVRSSACPPQTSFAAVLGLGVRGHIVGHMAYVCRSCQLSH